MILKVSKSIANDVEAFLPALNVIQSMNELGGNWVLTLNESNLPAVMSLFEGGDSDMSFDNGVYFIHKKGDHVTSTSTNIAVDDDDDLCDYCGEHIDNCECEYCDDCGEHIDNCECEREMELEEGEPYEEPISNIGNIANIDGVEEVHIVLECGDPTLLINTKKIVIQGKDIGEFEIIIRIGDNPSVTFHNTTRVFKDPNGDGSMEHPHIRENVACFGNLSSNINSAMSSKDFYMTAMFAMEFLKTANIDDAWGVKLSLYPPEEF